MIAGDTTMARWKQFALQACIVTCILSLLSSGADAGPLTTTVCELDAHPARYDHRIIRIIGARFESDAHLEHVDIVDEMCPNTAVALVWDNFLRGTSVLAELERKIEAVSQKPFHEPYKTVLADVEGVFYGSDPKGPLSKIRLVSATDVRIVDVAHPFWRARVGHQPLFLPLQPQNLRSRY